MRTENISKHLIRPEARIGGDHKEMLCDYVRRACLAVAGNVEDYLPDKVYTDMPGEVVIRMPLDGAATIEASAETYLLGK